MLDTKQLSQVQQLSKNLSGLGTHRPRVVWDMTFTIRSQTGTRVYTQNLYQTLRATSAWEFVELYGTREIGPRGRGNLKSNAQNIWWLLNGAERQVKLQPPDLYHAAAFLAPLRVPCPFVLNVFDTTYIEFHQHYDWKWNFYARTFIPNGIKNASAILTLSEHARGEIVRAYRVPRERVTVVPPGIGAEFQPPARAEAIAAMRAKYGVSENYLIHGGGAHARKNVPALIAAFARLCDTMPDLTLTLYGPHVLESARIREAIQAHGLAKRVTLLGYIPPQDLPALLAGARAFVYASKLEGFGMPPVEAMACGTPVVSAPNPPMPEVLGDAAYLTENDSPEALAVGRTRVLKDDVLAQTLRARGMERARLYTWENAARKTLAVYENILAKQKAAA